MIRPLHQFSKEDIICNLTYEFEKLDNENTIFIINKLIKHFKIMDKELNYEQDINIDPESLDVEWLQQPKLMLKYTNLAAETKRTVDLAKEKLDLIKAELDKQIRTHPEDFIKGIDKITEALVSNTILSLGEYIDVNAEYIEARYQNEITNNAVRALEQKKSALENLVKLYGQQYFAGPKVPRDLSNEWVKKQDQKSTNEKIGTEMKRMTRK
jgi:hypothetical protein